MFRLAPAKQEVHLLAGEMGTGDFEAVPPMPRGQEMAGLVAEQFGRKRQQADAVDQSLLGGLENGSGARELGEGDHGDAWAGAAQGVDKGDAGFRIVEDLAKRRIARTETLDEGQGVIGRRGRQNRKLAGQGGGHGAKSFGVGTDEQNA